jgi:hypothetical protein
MSGASADADAGAGPRARATAGTNAPPHASDAGDRTHPDQRDAGSRNAPEADAASADAGLSPVPTDSADDADESPRAGLVQDDDSTVWCVARLRGEHGSAMEAFLRRVPSDADEPVQDAFVLAGASMRAALTCTEQADGSGTSMLIASDPSSDDSGDRVALACPAELPFGRDPQCSFERDASSAVPFLPIYLPGPLDADGVPRADGSACIAAISKAEPHGQVTGFVPELMQANGTVVTSLPLRNEQVMRTFEVGGTDEGSIFLARGKLHFIFGDTGATDINDPLTFALQGTPSWRSNVLGYSDDFDASDGIQLTGFDVAPGATRAAENVISEHAQVEAPGSETTAIPLAGFAFTAADGKRYRFQWFVSIHKWSVMLVGPDFEANYSTLAYSVDESPRWTRLTAPAVPAQSFGPGAVWFDRYQRWLYFFGIVPDRGAVHLARVRSTFASVTDPAQYEYWDGRHWQPNAPDKAIALIAENASYAPRSEISVIFNRAANVWMMMAVNWYSMPAATPSNQVELWQAPAVTGPWQRVDADAQLPNGNPVLMYGPMMSEHLLIDGGREVPFLLSQMFPVYNVHDWSYRIEVATGAAAAKCPH